jgi:hypothetical protein
MLNAMPKNGNLKEDKMKKMLLSLVLFGTLASAAHAQEPSLAQCKAHRDAWAHTSSDLNFPELSWREIRHRADEMSDCVFVLFSFAKKNPKEAAELPLTPMDFGHIANNYHQAFAKRYERFLDRHHLSGQFMEEDEHGKGRIDIDE